LAVKSADDAHGDQRLPWRARGYAPKNLFQAIQSFQQACGANGVVGVDIVVFILQTYVVRVISKPAILRFAQRHPDALVPPHELVLHHQESRLAFAGRHET
jgi:predicted ATP-grasp superfamily ATP-dependent carboligase